MTTISHHAAVRSMRVDGRLTRTLLVLETLVLVGLMTSWQVAAIVAIVLSMTLAVYRALRRAARQLDTILREELTIDD